MENLNNLIERNLQNAKGGINYELHHTIARMMATQMQMPRNSFQEITTPSTEEQTKSIVLGFFKDLDDELYKKVKEIMEGTSEIGFNMYSANSDIVGTPLHPRQPCVLKENGRPIVCLPYERTIQDVYLLTHELSHTFDMMPRENITRYQLGEVTPSCFEGMLSSYLLKNNLISKEDAVNREKGIRQQHYAHAVKTFAKLELMKTKQQKGTITREDLENMKNRNNLDNRQMDFVMRELCSSKPDSIYEIRYMLAQLIYSHYMEQYNQNPQEAIQNLKGYWERIKDDDLYGSLEQLGIEPNLETIQSLINSNNRRLQILDDSRVEPSNNPKSVQELGKETLPIQQETTYIDETEQEENRQTAILDNQRRNNQDTQDL